MLSAGANYSVLKLLGEKNNALENLLLEISIEEENFLKRHLKNSEKSSLTLSLAFG